MGLRTLHFRPGELAARSSTYLQARASSKLGNAFNMVYLTITKQGDNLKEFLSQMFLESRVQKQIPMPFRHLQNIIRLHSSQ
jgi:hypothetical protein